MAVLHFGAYRLAGPRGPLHRLDAEVRLPPKALAVLWLLASRSGQVVTRSTLLDEVWTGTAVGEDALGFQVQALRHALEDDVRRPRYIATVHRVGYRFVASVTSVESELGPPAGVGEPPATSPCLLVGRSAELRALEGLLGRALGGERQVVFVTGEAGIGKTALVESFLARAGPFQVARGRCVEHFGPGEAYLPLLDALRRLCREPDGDRVLRILRRHAPACLAQMPSVEAAPDVLPRAVDLTRTRMLRELAEAVEVIAEARPLILLLEDLQWSDVSTVELISMLARRPDRTRLLLLATYRPVDLPPDHPLRITKPALVGRTQACEIALGYLDQPAVHAFVASRLHSGAVDAAAPAALADVVHRRTGGHPLFMVHITGFLLERPELLACGGHAQAAAAMEDALPERLRELIEGELERLRAEEQRLLEVASVAGAEFEVPSVAAAARMPGEAVETMCDRLSRSGRFITGRGLAAWPDGSIGGRYGFRHAVYQQVVGGRVGAGRRAQLHQAIGARKATAYGERAGEIAAELARHFEAAGDLRQAAAFHRQAAEKSLRVHAYPEALASTRAALDLLQHEPRRPEDVREQLLVHLTRGAALLATRGFSAPEVEQTYRKAHLLSHRLNDVPTLLPVLYGLWNISLTKADLARARSLAGQLLALAARHADTARVLPACNAGAWTAFFRGEAASAQRLVNRSLALYDRERDGASAALYGEDPGVVGHMGAALIRWWLGDPSGARRHLDSGLRLARDLDHPFGIAQMLWADALVSQQCGYVDRVLETTRHLVALCASREFALWLAGGRTLHGWALAEAGQVERGIEEMERGIAAWRGAGADLTCPFALALLAAAHARRGAAAQGLRELEEAAATARRTGEHWYDAELVRLRGELTLQGAGRARRRREAESEAERFFVTAAALAGRRGARSLELRAAISLARLPSRHRTRNQARARLARLTARFRRTDATSDLAAARALLAH